MISLKTKITIALIGIGFLAIITVGLSARTMVVDRFDEIVIDRSAINFERGLGDYYSKYGSWQAAYDVEPFLTFLNKGLPRNNRPGANPNSPEGTSSGEGRSGFGGAFNTGENTPTGNRSSGGLPRGSRDPFFATDMNGYVWVPSYHNDVGDIISEKALQDARPVILNGEQIGYLMSEQRLVLTDLEVAYLSALQESLIFSILLVAAFLIPLGFFLGNRLASPIKNLSRAIQSMRSGEIHQAVPVTSGDELGELSEGFNQMSGELASFIDVIQRQKEQIIATEALRREGIASISHELVTPLQASVLQANAMRDGIRPSGPAQMDQLSNSLIHLGKLVDDLFQLSLADVDALECRKDIIDFSMIVNEAVDVRKNDFTLKDFSVVTNLPQKLEVQGDATRLRQIIDNLLENCIKYTKKGGKIKVELQPDDDFGVLTVSDNGPGVSPENITSLFERFYREESSRNRDTGGSGLGLSLVKVWAEAHGGFAKAFLSADGGLAVSTNIPLST